MQTQMDQHEKDANEAIAINAVNRRLTAVGRINWGIVDVSAKHVIENALAEIVNDKVSPAYAEQAQVTEAEQQRSGSLDAMMSVLNQREKAA